MNFKNPDVAAKYDSAHAADPIVHLPGGKNKNGWKGNLSSMPLEVADRVFARPAQNLLKLKETQPAAKAAQKPVEKKD